MQKPYLQIVHEFLRVGNFAHAEMMALQAVASHPQDALAWVALATVQSLSNKHEEALAALEQALRIDPANAGLHYQAGVEKLYLRQEESAVQSFRRAVEINPRLPQANRVLGTTLLSLGQQREAIAPLRRAMVVDPNDMACHSKIIEALDFLPDTSVEEAQAERKRWNESFAVPLRDLRQPHSNDRNMTRKLRIGYASPNFADHSPTRIFGPIMFSHDAAAFEVHAFSYVQPDWEDAVTRKFREGVAVWHNIFGKSDAEADAMIRAAGIDILVDLAGHGYPGRLPLFARKPAPVQVTAWGFATGTGLETMDYMFADPVSVPEEERRFFAEKIADLSCVLCFDLPAEAPPVADLPCQRNGFVTFGCLNRVMKIDQGALRLWAAILQRVPGSKLLLKDRTFDEQPAIERQQRYMADLGIGPERLILKGWTDHFGHLAAYHDVDLALDPLAHSGALCTCEALAMGVPTLGLHGNNLTRRQTAAINIGLGFEGFVAHSHEDYVAKACDWAARTDELAALRPTLRKRFAASPIGNVQLYTREVEDWYRRMWRTWCETAA